MENWKVTVEYPSYSISSLGRVKNNTTNKVPKAVPNTFGYLQVRLYKEGQYKVFYHTPWRFRDRITGSTGYIVGLNSAFGLIGPQKGI